MIKKYWKEICIGAAGILIIGSLWNNRMHNLEKEMKERITAESELERELANSHFIITNNRNYYFEYNRGWIIEASTEEWRGECGLYMRDKKQEEINRRSKEITDYIMDSLEKNKVRKFESLPILNDICAFRDRG